MLLSILIPSLPERLPKLTELLGVITAQAHPQVEVLVLMDNRRRTLGEKRNALMREAAGRFCCHIDDDDLISTDFVARLLPVLTEDVDLIHYDATCSLNGSRPFRVFTGLGYDNEQPKHLFGGGYSDIRRWPWTWCCWRTSLARQFAFPEHFDAAEDATWLRKILPAVRTSVKVDAPLFHHRYDRETTTFPKE